MHNNHKIQRANYWCHKLHSLFSLFENIFLFTYDMPDFNECHTFLDRSFSTFQMDLEIPDRRNSRKMHKIRFLMTKNFGLNYKSSICVIGTAVRYLFFSLPSITCCVKVLYFMKVYFEFIVSCIRKRILSFAQIAI